jgi:hypothetical protein
MAELIVRAVVGGLISPVSTIVVDVLRSRREDQRRWDTDRLEAIVELVSAAQEVEAIQYRRGRAVHDYPDPEAPSRVRREEEARQAVNSMWVAMAKATLLARDVKAEIDSVYDTARVLNSTADTGFASRAPEWLDTCSRHRAAIEALSTRGGEQLGLRARSR